jgi:hypothetical protein
VGKTAPRHTSAEFIAVLSEVAAKANWAIEIHIVLDNLAGAQNQDRGRVLAISPKVRFDFTPT